MNEWSALGNWTLPIALLGLALAVWLMWNEARRGNRRQLLLRLVATFVAVVALFALIVQPTRTVIVNFSEAALLTEGVSMERVKRFIDSSKVAHVFEVKSLNNRPSSLDFTSLPDLAYLRRNFPDVNVLHVFGNGLASHDLAELNDIELRLHLDELSDGLRWMSSPASVPLGERVRIQGSFSQSSKRHKVLYFSDAKGATDSLKLNPSGETLFEFSTLPKSSGRFLDTLFTRTATGDTLMREFIPIVVEKPDTLSILILENAPNFETKQLKYWAASTGNRVAIRFAISKGRSATEFLNLEKFSLGALSKEILNRFDIVVLDALTLAALTVAEREALRDAIENGLGLVIQADDMADLRRSFSNSSFFLDFPSTVQKSGAERAVKPTGFGRRAPSAISAAPIQLKIGFGAKALVTDEHAQPLVVSKIRGLGKVCLNLVHNTYRWALEGNADGYGAYWSHVLNAVARKNLDRDEWRIVSETPVAQTPIELTLQTCAPNPLGILKTGATVDTIFLAQDALNEVLWRGTFWARTHGWHYVSNGESNGHWFYVFDDDAHRARRAAEMQAQTLQFVESKNSIKSSIEARQIKRRELLPLWWFFLAFVIAIGYLWIEQKI